MATVWASDVLEASQVRICSAAGEVVGAGFLISVDVVCTCAHVVARALGLPDSVEWVLEQPVDLDLPLLVPRARARVRATVVSWRHGKADVALLRLDAVVEGARPVPLVDGTAVWGHTFRAFGYPAGADHGVWASGVLRAGQGSGLVQMEAREPGPRIAEGFSGSPVWDDTKDGVVGMTVAAHRGERIAYLLPSADLIDERTLRPHCPFQGLAAFTEHDAEYFHGRDSDISRVYTAMRRRPVTLVAGPSGCGKSSLVRAGVLPRLRAEGMSVTELRPMPGVRAAAVLSRALTGVLEPGLGEVDRLVAAEELARLLETSGDVTADLRGRVLLACGENTGHVLFVDQLEEYVAAHRDTARTLFTLLAALAGKDGAAVLRVVATVRPDSLDVLVTADTSDLVSDAVQFLAPLPADELERAVTAPVDAVPGLWLEPGLSKRIVADAGDEPGRMPLVQFALTELWKRRTRSMLTHTAYDELGGVAGALVGYADDALAGLTRAQQEHARRLFVQLARPDTGDSFSRRPTRATDLAPELLSLARELAPGKLVVLSRAPGGTEQEEIVDLAHAALVELWPRLRQWLVDTRDFRSWQEQLRVDLNRWQSQGHERTRLLSGSDLAEAERRLAECPEDVSADERGYVLLSRRHALRGTRLRQAAVGGLAVLTVLASVLALSTWQGLKRVEEHLRTQAADLLAQAALDRPSSDPATALQLALAAWNTQPTDKARQALLHEYARGQYLVGSYPSLWQGQATGMDATPDGRTLVVRSKPSGGDRSTITLLTGAPQGRPHARELSNVPHGTLVTALSPDGRFFAAIAREGVRLWQLSNPDRPRLLTLGDHELPEKVRGTLDFSSDATRLLMTMADGSSECFHGTQRCAPTFAEAWQVPSGTRIDVPELLISPEARLSEAVFTSDANTVATISRIDETERIEVRDFTTGQLQYTSTTGNAKLVAGGEILVRTTDATTWYRQTLGRTPARRITLSTGGVTPDATSRYDVDTLFVGDGLQSSDSGGYAEPTLTDLRNGHTYRTRIPTSGDSPAAYKGVAAVPREGDGLTVFVPVGTALMAVHAEPTGSERFQRARGTISVSPDRRFVAATTEDRLEVLDVSRTHHESVSLPPPAHSASWIPTWTGDSQRIVVWGDDGNLYRSYSGQDLHDSVPLDNLVPNAKELDSVIELLGGEVDSVAALQGSEIVLLTVDGRLTRVDAADAVVRTRPFFVQAEAWNVTNLSDIFDANSQLLARPGHPGQVAVVTRKGAQRGEILLWDVRAQRHIITLQGPAIDVPHKTSPSSLAFNADGSRFAVLGSDGQVRVWDVDRREPLAHRDLFVPGYDNALVGFGPGDSIVTLGSGSVHIHDLMGGSSSDTLSVVDGRVVVHDHRLTIDNANVRQTFDLRPDTQFRTLCASAGRDYTKLERERLPEGTPSEPPCA